MPLRVASHCLAQIVAQENANFNGVGGDVTRGTQRKGAGSGDGLADFTIRVLVEHHVDGAGAQTFAGGRGQFVGDDAEPSGTA